MATLGGPAIPVSVQTGGQQQGGPAIPVAVVTDGRAQQAGPAQPVYVVTSGPVQGGPALPVVAAAAGARVAAGPAQPIYVVSGSFAAPVDPTMVYTNKVKALNPIAYWPLADASGTTATDESGNSRNGTYNGPALGQPGIGDGRTSAYWDNSGGDYVDVYSASLAGAFNKDEGTLFVWASLNTGIWTNGAAAHLFQMRADGSNRVYIQKSATNNTLVFRYQAGGTSKTVTFLTAGPAGFWSAAITWSKAADQVIAYFNGAQAGTTQTALGVWAGALASNATLIGAELTTPSVVSKDAWIAHAAVWNTPLSAAQIANLAVVP